MRSKTNDPIHRTLSGIALAGMILSLCLGMNGSSVVKAQEAGTGTSMEQAGPPEPVVTPLPPPPTFPPSYPPGTDGFADGGRFPSQANAGTSLLPVTVGASGLSFRYVSTFGVTGEPYLADGSHLNGPNGIYIDGTDALYVVEESGFRMLKYDISGTNTLIIGHAGLSWADLSWPKDVALDGAGNIWIVKNPSVLKYDSTGNQLLTIPPVNPWESGSDDYHFSSPRGIAFDSGGRLFVSDTENHRIQVYDLSGATPAYLLTIGVTGVRKTDNNGFSGPAQIAFDSLGRLYVMDSANYRVQRCTKTAGPPETWGCSLFFGETGVNGSDLFHLSYAYGITIRNDVIFIADGLNYRVLKCNTAGACNVFAGVTGVAGSDNSHFRWPADVAVDSEDNIYISDWDINFRIQKYNSAGVYQSTSGVIGVPYLTDASRLNSPTGIAVTTGGDFYVTERFGYRLVKMNSSGAKIWSVGQAGVPGSDSTHLGSWWFGLEGSPAIDTNGRVYVGDTGNNRVQIFTSGGAYYATLGVNYPGGGSGVGEFQCPADVAISPVNGDIYVADRCNQRIQVFGSNRVFKTQLGVTGTSGADNMHFNNPWGVTVDGSGNIFVADSDNHRVQKCNLVGLGYSCSTFSGETGVSGADFGHFGRPLSVKTDASGRVYVADEWNSRVQVFDSSGAYLTTIAGNWGQNSGSLIGPSGIALDGSGNVFVTDRENHRIQMFAPGTPGWRQANINGFGDLANIGIWSMSTFNGQIYAGTQSANGAQVWRSADGRSWDPFTPFWTSSNELVFDMQPFGSYLYAGTYNNSGAGGEIWRSDGETWSKVVDGGFGDANNSGINSLAVFSNTIYAATSNDNGTLMIYRSSSGDLGSWTAVVSDGLGSNGVAQDVKMDAYGGYLYIGLGRNGVAELWRTSNGTTWTPVFTNGLAGNNTHVSAMADFGGTFYIGLRNVTTGGEVWASSDGTNFSPGITGGLGNPNNQRPYGLIVFEKQLYLVFANWATGVEVWRTSDGSAWDQIGSAGWGDSNNITADYFDKGATIFNGKLFFGSLNGTNGGEIWQLLKTIFLPMVKR